ncbi:hypothetical protein B0H11DRAFT_631224 [Mycena galericulata]|nr:hypothetical protein B0H11DRAFT_631224 [Mycena galericulata]
MLPVLPSAINGPPEFGIELGRLLFARQGQGIGLPTPVLPAPVIPTLNVQIPTAAGTTLSNGTTTSTTTQQTPISAVLSAVLSALLPSSSSASSTPPPSSPSSPPSTHSSPFPSSPPKTVSTLSTSSTPSTTPASSAPFEQLTTSLDSSSSSPSFLPSSSLPSSSLSLSPPPTSAPASAAASSTNTRSKHTTVLAATLGSLLLLLLIAVISVVMCRRRRRRLREMREREEQAKDEGGDGDRDVDWQYLTVATRSAGLDMQETPSTGAPPASPWGSEAHLLGVGAASDILGPPSPGALSRTGFETHPFRVGADDGAVLDIGVQGIPSPGSAMHSHDGYAFGARAGVDEEGKQAGLERRAPAPAWVPPPHWQARNSRSLPPAPSPKRKRGLGPSSHAADVHIPVTDPTARSLSRAPTFKTFADETIMPAPSPKRKRGPGPSSNADTPGTAHSRALSRPPTFKTFASESFPPTPPPSYARPLPQIPFERAF